MDFKEFYREFEAEVKEDLSAALWDKARVKADPEGFAKELFDSDIGFTAEEAAEEFVDMIHVMKDQGEFGKTSEASDDEPTPFENYVAYVGVEIEEILRAERKSSEEDKYLSAMDKDPGLRMLKDAFIADMDEEEAAKMIVNLVKSGKAR